MSTDRQFYPEVLSAEDLKMLHETVHDLLEAGRELHRERDPEYVAKIVLRLYRIGLTEPGKLFRLASMMADREAEVGHSAGDDRPLVRQS